jgi:hypothetical protein
MCLIFIYIYINDFRCSFFRIFRMCCNILCIILIVSVSMTVASGIIGLTEHVCKTGDSNNIQMDDVCKIALLDEFRNSMCTDKERLLWWDSNRLYPAYESLVLPFILNICLNEDVFRGIVFQCMPKTYFES